MARIATFYAVALIAALLLTPLCRYFAQRFGFVATPKEDRWHKRPTALFGGVAIAATALALGVVIGPDERLWELLACGSVVAAFGLVDDLMSLKASTKLIMQISVASALVFLGYRLNWTESMAVDAMLTLFWVVGITNGFNLLDNMDGLCAGITLIAGTFLLAGLYTDAGLASHAVYLAVLLGATTGFLVYNLHPASIFMGDAGSLFLGFNLAALTLIPRTGSAKPTTSGVLSVVAGPVLLLLIPIFDTTLVTVMRLLSGRRPSQGGRDHSSHRLVALGLPESTAVTVLWTLAALGGVIALSLQMADQTWIGTVAFTFVIAVVIFAVYLARIRVYDDAAADELKGKVTPLFVDFMYKRRVAEVLLDVCLIPLAYYSAYRLRFEGEAFRLNYPMFLNSLPVIVSAQLMSLFIVGGYRGTWRYFGIMDAVVFAKGVLLGTVSSIVFMVFAYHFANYSRAVFIIYAALLMLLLAGTRASFRLVGEFVSRRRSVGQRCVIYGTSGVSVATIREAFGHQPFRLLGFADDDPIQANSRVGGYPVIGDFGHLLRLIETNEVECVVLNNRVADVNKLQRLDEVCRAHDVELVVLNLNLKPFTLAS
jgi:UDP-GlcNAc:undecaprenyl-phosphate/decaprenyl-phosphate GlcNAc-1-phosphate transferase